MKYTYLCYNLSKSYPWSLHRAGCSDIAKELKGIHTDSGFPATVGDTFEASSIDSALDHVIDSEMKEMGWTHDDVHVFPCCRDKRSSIKPEGSDRMKTEWQVIEPKGKPKGDDYYGYPNKKLLEKTLAEVKTYIGEKVMLSGGGGPGSQLAVLKGAHIEEFPMYIGGKDVKRWGLKADLELDAPFAGSRDFDPWLDSWQIAVKKSRGARRPNPQGGETCEELGDILASEGYNKEPSVVKDWTKLRHWELNELAAKGYEQAIAEKARREDPSLPSAGIELPESYMGGRGDYLVTHKGYQYTTKQGKTIHVKSHTERKPPPSLGRMRR